MQKQVNSNYRLLLMVLLALISFILGCEPQSPELALMPEFAERLQLPQRSTSAIPTKSGENSQLLIRLGDITRNQVRTSIRTREGMLISHATSLSPGSALNFDFASARYQLSLLNLDNQLLGTDYAYFALRQLSAELLPMPNTAPPSMQKKPPISPVEAAKIEQLLAALGALENVYFIRNGRAHSASEAVAHMRRKWETAADEIASAQEFIDKIGTRSSSTGELYQLRYADGRMQNAADFLKAELARVEGQMRV
jgi:Family of unknown function (DUF5329)